MIVRLLPFGGLLLSSCLLGVFPPAAAKPAASAVAVEQAVAFVKGAEAYVTVEQLAGPECAGRLTGSPGFERAVRLMADEFKKLGLVAPAGAPDYQQRFPHTLTGVTSSEMVLLPVDSKEEAKPLKLLRDFMPMHFSGSGEVTSEVIFVGYGITAPAIGRDDYAGLDVKGKIVMAVRGAPEDGRDWLAFNSHRARGANALAHGAAAYLFAEFPGGHPNGDPTPGLVQAVVTNEIADKLIEGSQLKLEEIRRMLAKGGVISFPTGRQMRIKTVANPPQAVQGANVIGILPGSDPAAAGEYLIIGAHLDGVGGWPVVLPGADDNASGSATVLEIARAAVRLNPRPRRSLVFVLFGGEENGLLGSKYLAGHSVLGPGRCLGVFNMDMLGNGNGAYVAGGDNFPALWDRLRAAKERQRLPLELKSGRSDGESRADHGPFQAAGIPAVSLFGFGNSHHGYHTDEDTLVWITPRTMELIGRMVLEAAVRLTE